MAKKRDKSLGDEFTQLGDSKPVSPPESERSLGDQSTYGDAGDSVTDVSGLAESLQDDMEIVDLSKRYQIEGVIGKGGMGEVLRAIDTRLDRPVAIKRVLGEMARSQKALARFLTEAKSIAALNHFNIVQIYDYGRDKDGPFIIMELVEGKSLHEKLKDGPLELEAAVDKTCQLCDALSKAHGSGIIHRDIKPANILLTEEGEPKLTDFGLARQETADHGQTMAGVVLGTIDFMPPEQRRDATATDARSDLWSLAATCYQMVTGKSPKVIRLNDVPGSLQDVLSKALEDEKEDRYQSAMELRDALKGCLAIAAGPAPEVAVELGAGECPSCHTKNESSRKFCRGCGDSLELKCLSCGKEMPVWENYCGACGSNQQGLVSDRRAVLDAQREQAESLRSEYAFDESLRITREIASVEDNRLHHQKEWAESFLVETKAEKERQEQNAANYYAEAKKHREAFDYSAAIGAMEAIPEPIRTDEMSSYLVQLQSDQTESQELLQTIKDRVKRGDLNGLLDQVNRLVDLLGNQANQKKLKKQLEDRREKIAAAEKVVRDKAAAEKAAAEKAAREKAVAWDLALERACKTVDTLKGHTSSVTSVAFSPDGKWIVSGSWDETVKVWDAETGKELLTLKGRLFKVTSVAFSPDGKRIVSGGTGGIFSAAKVKIWDAVTGQEIVTLKGHTGWISSVAFSPNGKRIVSGSRDKTLKVWDADTGQEITTLRGHSGSVNSVIFSPDGKRIASGSQDNTVKVWNSKQLEKLVQHTLKGHSEGVNSVAFSADDKRIVSGSTGGIFSAAKVKIWDAVTGQEIGKLKGHSDYVNSVAFSPDGKQIVTGSGDYTVKVGDAETGQKMFTLKGHTDRVNSVAFSPDGRRIVSGSADYTVKVWDVSSLAK